ncbi:MAG: DNA primase [Pseudomonadota bacterium]
MGAWSFWEPLSPLMPRFNPEYLDELKSRLRPSDIIGRQVQLKKRGNLWWGLSPFKTEKTPSFAVNDERRSYHCYSTDNHGDIIKFLQETQNLSFIEAVTRLAGEAGMEIPADDPRAADKAKARKSLSDASTAAAGFFAAQLRRLEGRSALSYIQRRGLSDAALQTFQIGYAPKVRRALSDYLINKGFSESQLVEAGLAIKPDDGGAAFDRFRDRVMFPILGARGETIAFGGRALDPNARAKYLNSPETPIFRKSEVLYNYENARQATARGAQKLLVCEGYMDVIALAEAGFTGAVAPLGTALTDRQIALLWRLQDEPTLCFDGDEAGRKAAYRAIDRAIPALQPGKSLSFVFLPNGQDPDDVVRSGGTKAFQALLDQAEPLVDVLWRRESEAQPLDTPERKAAFRARLRAVVKEIADADVRNAYASEIVSRFRADAAAPAGDPTASFEGGFSGGFSGGERAYPRRSGFRQAYRSEHDRLLKRSKMSEGLKNRRAGLENRREATIALAVLRHPSLVWENEEVVMGLEFHSKPIEGVMSAVFAAILADPDLDSAGLTAHVQKTSSAETLEQLLADEWLNQQLFLRTDAELHQVRAGLRDALRLQLLATNANAELIDSASRLFGDDDTADNNAADNEKVWKAVTAARDALVQSGDSDYGPAGDASEGGEADGGSGDGVSGVRQASPALMERLKRTKARFE